VERETPVGAVDAGVGAWQRLRRLLPFPSSASATPLGHPSQHGWGRFK